ncbi:class I SAM-dependent methyltransferase [Hamadaea sp. NPDC051192]|uniref:class I SAM-dependent methyltransferase n=1 Tax=Hamadaea sp. NPDC051192 TaxID=3154940 RepID=UPI0034316076
MTNTDIEQRYGFDNTSSEGGNQLQHLAGILDPHSINVLTSTGITPGMRCLDIGPGAGTITHWLAEQVGPDGRVTAIDIAPALSSGPNIGIRQEDIRVSDFDPGSFDLIHARLVLMHLPERLTVLQKLADWLRPGGTIVLSEWDCTYLNLVRHCPEGHDPSLHDLFQTTLINVLTPRGMSTTWATEAHGAMLHSGLTKVSTVVDARTYHGGTGICQLHYSNSHQLNDALLAAGMTEQQLASLRKMLLDPRLMLSGYLMHTTTGRRPAAH